ncbi:MAG: hypothetical protein LUG18_13490 [Candidatus Azobacteroides sp.]|nr:hypothetical protein [Candidatus Azobacteroides sp.]
MNYKKIYPENLSVQITLNYFKPKNGIGEYHSFIELTDPLIPVKEQFCQTEQAIKHLEKISGFEKMKIIWKRYFLSDAVNQASLIPVAEKEAVSLVQQPPLNGMKLSVWIYAVEQGNGFREKNTFLMKRNSYLHIFHTRMHSRNGNSFSQTNKIFREYKKELEKRGNTLKTNCIRTWLFVQNVDIHYQGMVKARTTLFEKEGMTGDTHYIASTGIEGRYIYPEVIVLMDAYAISGLKEGQVSHLHALTHLNPTHEYGVTFERGTVVSYGDRRHIFISGTASINNKGQILHPLNIKKQTGRVLENIEALLSEAGATMADIAYFIIYLRDTADFLTTDRYFKENYPQVPAVILLAPVCRPGWLIEIECMALKENTEKQYEKF